MNRRKATYMGTAAAVVVAAVVAAVVVGLRLSDGTEEKAPVVWTNLNCRQMDIGIQGAVVTECHVNEDGTVAGNFGFQK